ncbi:MAG: cytochrome P450 [Spirulinaceae cyanobacterium]
MTASASTPPGTLGLPFIGETFNFLLDGDFINKRRQQYGDVFKSHILGKPTIFVCSPEANQFILSNENQYFVVGWPPSTKALLGPLSLALQTGGTHVQRRKMLYQAFTPRALDSYVPTIAAITQQYLDTWTQQKTLTWYPQLRNYTFDIACKLFVGLDSGSQTNLGQWFEVWTEGLFTIPLRLPWTKFGRAFRCRDLLLQELERIIRDRQQNPTDSQDALELLIQARDEDGNPLSVEELKDQILLLLFAGHETLTSAIASCCLLLAQHPEVIDKIRTEQAKFSQDEPLTLEKLKQMTYIDQVMREVLRFMPPVGGGFREAIANCEFQGYTFPKGWNISYQINQTHQDGEIYSDPQRFDPDRFSPERQESKAKPFAYVPFGGGLRECIGKEFARLEIKIFAAMLCQDYDWQLLPDQDLNMVMVPTPHPRDGLKVAFSARS